MGWGRRVHDSDKVRDALIERAGLKMATTARLDQEVLLAAVYLELVRLNDALEARESSVVES